MNGFPIDTDLSSSELRLILRDIPVGEFQDAFVEDTIQRINGIEITIPLICTDFEINDLKNISPAGIVYHVSKCGSTLISQLLKCSDEAIIYSQPPVLNNILMPPHRRSKEETVKAIRSVGLRLSQHANKKYILKLESWNTLFSDLISTAFPFTPWIFSIRDPIEVVVSVMEDPNPPTWYKYPNTASNPFAPFIGHELGLIDSPGYHFSSFYMAFCEAIMRLNQKNGAIVFYEELPGAVWEVIAPHFGLSITDKEIIRMTEVKKYYSKSTYKDTILFRQDTLQKHERINNGVKAFVNEYARPLFNLMLSKRYIQSK